MTFLTIAILTLLTIYTVEWRLRVRSRRRPIQTLNRVRSVRDWKVRTLAGCDCPMCTDRRRKHYVKRDILPLRIIPSDDATGFPN